MRTIAHIKAVLCLYLGIMSQPKKKRELWSRESMMAAVESVEDGKGFQEASRLYSVQV